MRVGVIVRVGVREGVKVCDGISVAEGVLVISGGFCVGSSVGLAVWLAVGCVVSVGWAVMPTGSCAIAVSVSGPGVGHSVPMLTTPISRPSSSMTWAITSSLTGSKGT